jgi:hypothetical protein
MPNQRIFLPLILLFVVLQCFFQLSGRSIPGSVLNIAVVITLSLILSFKTRLKGRFHKRIFTALIVITAGLVYFYFRPRYTELKSSLFFFVIPQLYFISAFYLDFKSAPALDKSGARLAIGTAFVSSFGYYLLIRSTLGILRLPFMIGLFCSSFLFMMASFRNLRVNKESFNLILGGVVVLVLSEAMFAYHIFAAPLRLAETIYPIASVIGYTLIVWGTIERKLLHPQGTI